MASNDDFTKAIQIIKNCILHTSGFDHLKTLQTVINDELLSHIEECLDAISEAADYQQFESYHWEEPNDTPDSIPCNLLNAEWYARE